VRDAGAAKSILDAVLAQKSDVTRLFDELRAGSPDPGGGHGVTRDTFGAGEQFGYAVIAREAQKLGLEQRYDHARNLFMTWPGADRSLPRLMTGSHIDSVPNGGNYDGAAGVVAGLVATRALQSLGVVPKRDVTTMAIRAEESVWFEVSYIGSRSAFGTLPKDALDTARRIDTQRTLAEHMAECGADIAAVRRGEASLRAKDVHAFCEIHIEQAPQLVEAGLSVAIGTGVPGNFRYPQMKILGAWAHVGLPRRFRRDVVMAGSEFALGLDEIWAKADAEGRPMAFTIGRFHTDAKEHALTKVAGDVSLSLDVRAYDRAHLAALEEQVLALTRSIAERRGVRFEMGTRTSADVAPSDAALFDALTASARALGIPTKPLASPASHDTATFAVAGVPSCMVFVRNANGSHNPNEAMEVDDFLEAAAILTHWIAGEVVA
jgi:N-carbamoyl-L-amino-acid hydrolase